jgi:hypothetical protein
MIGNSRKWLFSYRTSEVDDSRYPLYYQVDMDSLNAILIFCFPLTGFFIVLSVMIILNSGKLHRNKNVLYKSGVLVACIEILSWGCLLLEIIYFSRSLVSCDDFVAGRTIGCYIP